MNGFFRTFGASGRPESPTRLLALPCYLERKVSIAGVVMAEAPLQGFEGPLAEYGKLRDEIESRSARQQNLVTTQLTIAGAVFGFALANAARTPLLLVIPIMSYLLCTITISQARWVGLVSAYISLYLSDKIPGGLYWETWVHNPKVRRRSLWTLPMLLTFPGT